MSDEKKQPTAAQQKLHEQRTTFFLVPNGEHEDRISRAYLGTMYGDSIRAQIVRAIPIARLTDQHAIVVVARKKVAPVVRRVPGPNGMPEEFEVPLSELIKDVVERPPLLIKNHWLEGGDDGGRVDEFSFFETLSKMAAPFCVNFRGDEKLIRLGYT